MHKTKTIGVLTSGEVAPGMNSAVRAIVRIGLYLKCRVYYIKDGYQGLVENRIEQATWESASNLIHRGGTVLGSQDCEEFKKKEGRCKAAYNLIANGINNLIVIGGAGSLIGLNRLKLEWHSCVEELVAKSEITERQAKAIPELGVCGLPSGVTNDFFGTEITLGTNTALSRIIDNVNLVEAGANSNQRVLIVEVVARNCGYLALTAGVAVEADFVFIPEWPPVSEWRDSLTDKLHRMALLGRRLNVILVAEGAIDLDGIAITSEMIKRLITEKLKYDCRILPLSYLQCGGSPTAFDRCLGARMGAEALVALAQRDESQSGIFMALRSNQIERAHLERAARKTTSAEQAYAHRDYELCVELRGSYFKQKGLFLDRVSFPPKEVLGMPDYTMLILHVGSPAAGMNAATHAVARLARYHNCRLLAATGGFTGFAAGDLKPLDWTDVIGWVSLGGSALGTSRGVDEADGRIERKMAYQLSGQIISNSIQGIIIVGGFEAYKSVILLRDARTDYDSFRIPIELIPATICNNMPGVPESIGSDTALNEICRTIDNIKQCARGSKKSVFIVEVQGGYSSYLTTMAAIATGADDAHIFEEEYELDDIMEDVSDACSRLEQGCTHYLLLRTQNASVNYDTEKVYKLFEENGQNGRKYETHLNVLGHSVQGGIPGAYDRSAAARYGAKAFERLLKQIKKSTLDCEVIGVRFDDAQYADVGILESLACFVHQNTRRPWWLAAHGLLRALTTRRHFEAVIPPEHAENAKDYQPRVELKTA